MGASGVLPQFAFRQQKAKKSPGSGEPGPRGKNVKQTIEGQDITLRKPESPGASVAEDLRAWLKKQETFKSNTALGTAIGTNRVSVRFWLAGRTFPRDEYCEKLH